VAPAVTAVPMRGLTALALAAVFAAAACGGMYALGAKSLADARGKTGPVGMFDDLAIAAAMPFSRDAALAEIAKRQPELKAQLEALGR
jgi:hypothetical protein